MKLSEAAPRIRKWGTNPRTKRVGNTLTCGDFMRIRGEINSGLDKETVISLSAPSSLEIAQVVELVDTHV